MAFMTMTCMMDDGVKLINSEHVYTGPNHIVHYYSNNPIVFAQTQSVSRIIQVNLTLSGVIKA